MSAIFVSHGSPDRQWAETIGAQLRSWEYSSFFLDFDAEEGIRAGRQWERELYVQLRSCDAVIVLCSRASMASSWCFAEITHAKALGKRIFPVRIDDCAVHSLLAEFQVIDASSARDEALQRLRLGLEAAGLSAKDMFAWDRTRAPFPGLGTFEREDAGVYFGRGRDIQAILEKLSTWRSLPGARLALIVGASGSGKSSLIRAGVLPRLGREPARWLVLDPIRPQGRPIEQLATVLDAALSRVGKAVGWRRIREMLQGGEATRRKELADLFTDLRSGAGQRGATVVITIDQAEELFTLTASAETDAFLAALKTCLELPGDSALALATLRSDFLGAWQSRRAHLKPLLETITLEQMGRENFREIINRPATLAGIDLEPQLVEAMVDDTGTQDALPLLAFALNALWTKHDARERWTLQEYRDDLGGIEGAIATAAEKLLAEAKPSAPEMKLLRLAFSAMVRVNDADQYVRRPALWKDLPERIRPQIGQFAHKRLLVIGGESEEARTVEVAHEALFRSWHRLAAWLREDREFFLWRRRLEAAVQAWSPQRDSTLVWRGASLAQGERYLLERPELLAPAEREFIDAGLAQRKAFERRRRRTTVGLTAGLVAALGLAIFAGLQWNHAREQTLIAQQQTRETLARQLARDADQAFDESMQGLTLSTLLAIESLKQSWTPDAFATLNARLELLPHAPLNAWRAHDGDVVSLALSADGRRLASTDLKDLAVWDLASGRLLRRFKPQGFALGETLRSPLALSRDGSWVVAACHEQICIWNVDDGLERPRVRNTAMISSLDFSPNGKELIVPGRGDVVVYEVGSWRELRHLGTESDTHTFAAKYTRHGAWIVFANSRGSLMCTNGIQTVPAVISKFDDPRESVELSPDGGLMVTGLNGPGLIEVWRMSTQHECADATLEFELNHRPGNVSWRTLSVADRGQFISAAPSARVWSVTGREVLRLDDRVQTQIIGGKDANLLISGIENRIETRRLAYSGNEMYRIEHSGEVLDVDFTADGKSFATATASGVRLFDATTRQQRASIDLVKDPRGFSISFDGGLLAIWKEAHTSLIDVTSGKIIHVVEGELAVKSGAFSPDASRLAIASHGNVHIVQTRAPFGRAALQHGADLVAFSPDGKWLASRIYADACPAERKRFRALEVFEASTGKSVALDSDRNAICREASSDFEPRGDAALLKQAEAWVGIDLMLPTADGKLRLTTSGEIQDAATGRKLPIISDELSVTRSMLSPDGRWLLAGTEDHGAYIWPMTAKDLIATACARLSRNLTGDEWKKYRADAPLGKTCESLPPGTPAKTVVVKTEG